MTEQQIMEKDPFATDIDDDQVAPPSVFFGEVIIHKGYQGIKLYDLDESLKGWQEYDPQDPTHQKALSTPYPSGKARKVHVCYEIQHYPNGANFDTYPNQWPFWSDEFITFAKSLCEVNGFDSAVAERLKNDEWTNERKADYAAYKTALKNLTSGNHYFMYETPVIRTYKKNDGTEGKVYSIKLLKAFDSAETCHKAMIDFKANQELPADDIVSEDEKAPPQLDLKTALSFVAALCGGIADSDKKVSLPDLQLEIDKNPMLMVLNAGSDEVKQAITDAGFVPVDIPF